MDLDAETESGPEAKTNEDYQGHKGDGQGESDEIVFIEENSEARDRGSTTSTTKKPRGVSFWPR